MFSSLRFHRQLSRILNSKLKSIINDSEVRLRLELYLGKKFWREMVEGKTMMVF